MPHPVTVTLTGEQVAERIRLQLPDAIRSTTPDFAVLEPATAFQAMQVIRDDESLDGKFLIQMCSVDMITRMDVVYHFASLAQNHMFEVKVPTDHEHPEVPSITPLWVGAAFEHKPALR